MEKRNIEKPFVSSEEYDVQGEAYVAAQREFYSAVPDTGRKFFQSSIESNISEKVIADIGCGAGDDLATYHAMGAKHVIGIDPSAVMLHAAEVTSQEKGLSIELLRGGWNHIPLPSDSVDVITARYSFHVIPVFDMAFAEVARVLKVGGHFLIAVPHPLYDKKLAQEQGVEPNATIESSLFGGKIIVKNFPHTMDDYVGEVAQKYFSVENLKEYSMSEKTEESEPTALLIDYQKK